jgi:hypothetical protein
MRMVRANGGGGIVVNEACVVAFYRERLLLSKRTLSIKGVSE